MNAETISSVGTTSKAPWARWRAHARRRVRTPPKHFALRSDRSEAHRSDSSLRMRDLTFHSIGSVTDTGLVDSEHRTVGELLRIAIDHEPAAYSIGSEPAEAPPPRLTRRRASPLDRTKVAPFLGAAKAGAPDADIARAAGVSVAQVRGWRLRLGIKRRPGATTMAKIHGVLLARPELARMLREHDRSDDTDPPPPIRFGYDQLAPFLERRGLGLEQRCETQFRERVSPGFGRRTR